MARPKQKRSNSPAALLVVVAVIGGIAFFLKISQQSTVVVGGIAVAGIWIAALVIRERLLRDAICTAVDRHIDALVRRRAQLLRTDAYGAVQSERWEKEIAHFIQSQVMPSLTGWQVSAFQSRHGEIAQRIENQVAEAAVNHPALHTLSANATPAEFEAFCAEQLRRVGWNAQVTKAGRDQGVDVIAQKNGVRVVLQCKFYSRPVGNKAVQEAVAGRAYERADKAAVVSNSVYTPAADELARTNGVLLLHYSQLRNLEQLIAT